MRTLFTGLEDAFRFFGGVPHELLFDQMRSVIVEDRRTDGGGLVENLEFLRFAHHCGFRPRACRPYRAKTKGKVERPIRYVRQSFFYGREFVSDDDLNDEAQQWLARVANVRVHRTTGERPIDRLEQVERAHLKPLARRPYRSLVLPPAAETRRRRPGVPTVRVERRPLQVYARIAGGER